jgi:apolipoprotein N-acyltransferase
MTALSRLAALSARQAMLMAFVAGALTVAGFAPPGFWWLPPFTLAFLFLLWLNATPRVAALTGFAFGAGLFGAGVSWVFVAIHVFGHSSVPVAVFLTALFVSYLALFPALAGWLGARLAPAGRARLLAVAGAWWLTEWLRGWLLTGFSWLQAGYSQIDGPLAGFAPVFGVQGMTLFVAVTASLLALTATAPRAVRRAAPALIALWGAGLALNHVEWTAPEGRALNIAIVQGNIPQDTKWRPEMVGPTLDLYARATRAHFGADLVLWPEAAVTEFYHRVADDFLLPLAREARRHGTDLVIGVPVLARDGSHRYYNSVVALSGEHAPGFYHKRHLVPFGDFVPFQEWLRGLFRAFDLPMSGFHHGPAGQPLLAVAGQRLAATVCYEDAFGEELLPALPAATLIVNLTNNAWYGDSLAPHQSLDMSRLRARETGRDLLRATTNGVSAIIAADGRVTARAPQFESAVLAASAQPRQGATPYVRWGNFPVLVLSLLLMAGGAWLGRRPG